MSVLPMWEAWASSHDVEPRLINYPRRWLEGNTYEIKEALQLPQCTHTPAWDAAMATVWIGRTNASPSGKVAYEQAVLSAMRAACGREDADEAQNEWKARWRAECERRLGFYCIDALIDEWDRIIVTGPAY